MSYLALARKWRPRTFSQLVGQEHVTTALINALNQQRLHHAYLFTGTRGVGKTSVARILAKSLNCEQGISSEPCLQCSACTSIEQGRFIDLIEIDAASKTRVEDTRELLDNVHYAPACGRFKIYLIDEVHMLSQHSFNALLKTLEEPPAHVKFILATTDPQKLPVTVLSRCLQFNLNHLSVDLIKLQLEIILKDEQLDFEIEALSILATAARGSMRDALSLLDQAITSCDKKLQATDVKKILGYTQQDYALQLLHALVAQNAAQILSLSQQIAVEGGHFQYVLEELLNHLHHITVYQNIGDNNPLISPSDEIKTLSQQLAPEDTQLFYQIALKGQEEIHLAPTLVIGFNMTLLRMLTFRPAPLVNDMSILEHEEQSASKIPSNPPEDKIPEAPIPYEAEKIIYPKVAENSLPKESNPEQEIPHNFSDNLPVPEVLHEHTDWQQITSSLKLGGLALNALENAELISKEGRTLTLAVVKGHQSLFTPTIVTRIEAALSDYYQNPVKISLITNQSIQASPAQQKEQKTLQKQQNAEAALHSDPMFQQLKQDFSAELVKNSIVPLKDNL